MKISIKYLLIIIIVLLFNIIFAQSETKPTDYYKIGLQYLNEKKYDLAIENLEKYVELTNNPNGKYQLGKAYLYAGKNLDKAVKIYKYYIKHYRKFKNKSRIPDTNGAYWRLGLVYERKGDLAKAKKVYEKAIKMDDLNGYILKALNNLGKNIDLLLSEKNSNYFSKKEAILDLNFLQKAMESVHPDLYAYTDSFEMNKKFRILQSELPDSISKIELYKTTAKYVVELKDGHTSVYPPYKNYYSNMNDTAFPFDIMIQDGRIFIKRVYAKEDTVFIGNEILTINNIKSQQILDELTKYQSAKKFSFKYQNIANGFRKLLYIIYDWKENFDVEMRNSENDIVFEIKIKGVEKQKIEDIRKKLYLSKEKPFKFYYFQDIKTGLIDFRSFSQLENFKVFLDSTFKFIENKNINDLIIDIRKNGGGNSRIGDYFLTYLTDKPYTMYSKGKTKYSRTKKNEMSQFIPKWASFFPFCYLFQEPRMIYCKPDGYIKEWQGVPKKHQISKPFFCGNTYILIGSNTFSSATDFASVFKDYSFGTLIGEETGGLATCYGDVLSFTMPNSGLQFGVSHKYFVRPGGFDDGKGVIPDYEMKQSIDDTKNGIDTVLEFTKYLIK